MLTNIQPNETHFFPDGGSISGFRLDNMFIPMKHHRGHVELFLSKSLKPFFKKNGNDKSGKGRYGKRCYELKIVAKKEINVENLKEVVATGNTQALVIVYLPGDRD